jgi:CRISPR-associated endonuclease/helicase Cas3
MRNREELAAHFVRVNVTLRGNTEEPTQWRDIASELRELPQVLCVVNTRRDCRELHALLPEETIHLSALMCGEHRSQVIAQIKTALKEGGPLRVISTQLVEAGVDLDFPVVYRAFAGLDSIAQAAGRCNREGLLPNGQLGQVTVFTPPRQAPPGLLRKGEYAAKEMFRCNPELAVSLSPDAFHQYFRLYFAKVSSFDKQQVLADLAGPDVRDFQIQFRTAASKFHLIDNAGQKSVIVWYCEGRFDSQRLIEQLRRIGPKRVLMRQLQRCTVNVPERAWRDLVSQGAIENVKGPEGELDIWAQCVPSLYDKVFGLRLEGPAFQGDEFVC